MARRRTLSLITAGTQKNGQPVDLDVFNQIVKNHSEQSRAPVSLGHPDKGADKIPALGRVSRPRIEGNELVVEIVYTPELEQLEDEGKFEGFSGGIYPRPDNGEYYLHHVAALGQLPPAADIKTRDVVQLSATDPKDMIELSATIKGFTMTEDEKKALVTEITATVASGLTTSIDTAIKAAMGQKPDEKKPGTGEGDKTVTDPKVGDLEKQVSTMQESTKADRIEQITELADKKGLSDDEKKPLIAMLKARPAVELCDNGEGGIFATTKAMLGARADKDTTTAGSADNKLFEPLEFADHKGNAQKVTGLSELAMKTGF